jgi:hypothetical protein
MDRDEPQTQETLRYVSFSISVACSTVTRLDLREFEARGSTAVVCLPVPDKLHLLVGSSLWVARHACVLLNPAGLV